MKILYISAEATPFAKVGGLADVAGSLPQALQRHDVDARLLIPCYQQVLNNNNMMLKQGPSDLRVYLSDVSFMVSIKTTQNGNVPVYLLDMPYYFHRENVYDYPDDAERFAAFCMGVIAFLKVSDWAPDVIHCNDWHTALVPAFLAIASREHEIHYKAGTVFTIHNLAYQGIVSVDMLDRINLPISEFTHHKVEFYGQLNIMKSGIYYSHRVNTVSPTYAREILTQEQGHGLDGMLMEHASKISGILNGIDTALFNPASDPCIPFPFTSNIPDGKRENKKFLLHEMRLKTREADMDAPLIGMVARLADQKGFDILEKALDNILKRNVRMVILGDGDPAYAKSIIRAADAYPLKIAVHWGFNEILAHRIYAGSDMFLMPSKYEPCGLGQMIAMRYGTVPIVRSTGGLTDTVIPFDPSTLRGNGFVFHEYTSSALTSALWKAVALFNNHPNAWQSLVRIVMKQDFSWDASALKYMDLYSQAIDERAQECRIE